MSKILRLVRMVRLVRISKIYKQISGGKKDPNKPRSKEDSIVGRKMSDQATKRLIMTTLMLIVCLPCFEADFWVFPADGLKGLCFQFAVVYASPDLFTTAFDFDTGQYIDWPSSDMYFQNATTQATFLSNQKYNMDYMIYNMTLHYGGVRNILKLEFPTDDSTTYYPYFENAQFNDWRIEEVIFAECGATSTGETNLMIRLWRNNSLSVTFGAILNVGRTIFVST